MDLDSFYPDPTDLLKAEVGALRYVSGHPYIVRDHSDFARDADRYYRKFRSLTSGFYFASHLDLWHPEMGRRGATSTRQGRRRANVRLMLAATIEVTGTGGYGNVSYCLCVCRLLTKGRLVILRKFHFDITPGSEEAQRRQKHPRSHMQYCGKMVPYMRTMGCREAQLDKMYPWLSEPRILFWPMSLALLMDMALREFPDERSIGFRESGEWKNVIREHEALVLQRFCKKCVDLIDGVHGNRLTLSDAFYVN
jgi:hypothetical protein